MADSPSQDQPKDIPGLGDLQEFSQQTLRLLVGGIQKANSLPEAGEDHDFYYSFSDFREFRKAQGTRILNNVHDLLKQFHVRCRWPNRNTSCSNVDVDDLYESLVEANDTLLEEVDTSLDEASGLSKNRKPILSPAVRQGGPMVSSWNRKTRDNNNKDGNFRLLLAKNIQRPQMKFKDKIDNSNTPFIPIIKYKPNALKPLDQVAPSVQNPEDLSVPSVIADFIHQQRVNSASENPVNRISHPYEFELQRFEPPATQLKEAKEQLYDSLEDTPFTLVETVEQLESLSQKLMEAQEFAVDLEHHSYRSFLGFVCLMQISTRDHDFLVDTLELRNDLHLLNESFTNPNILKVFHGADMDVGWLQRDFGIYVVNMFDTGQASRVLALERFSLAFLLKKFCGVTADKQYQLADWRIRPLPEEMIRYAREDTHYLLYIHDRLRNELIRTGNENNNLLLSVYSRSTEVCQKHYEKPLFTSESYMNLYTKQRRPLNPVQLRAFRALYAWRDTIARREDESYGYVLPNHMLFTIAETLPREPQGVLACCNPVPTLVKQYVNEVHQLILQSRDASTTTVPVETNETRQQTPQTTSTPSPSTRPQSAGGKRPRPRLLSDGLPLKRTAPFEGHKLIGPPVKVVKPVISLFDQREESPETEGQKKAKRISASFINPFKVVLPTKTPDSSTGEVNRNQPKADAAKINQQWKDATEQPMNSTQGKVAKDDEDHAKVTAGKRDRSQSDSEPEDTTPLRQKGAGKDNSRKRRHRKKTGNEAQHSAGSDEEDEPSYDVISQDTREFVPFDYNPAEYSKLSGQNAQPSTEVFNPYEKARSEKQSSGPRSKVHMKSGQRSMTYSKKRDFSKKQQWPSR
ncbi:exosome component 10 isoform X2 [Nematostella vectensis]|uniref:exosome component 10 isoform X2 n=1 Tax=Nematostella vectensis TaxID=45351 RepID=UPI0013906D5F|nr:exosome component 10 isoform X2 [Nematostella vectensis]